MADLFIIIKRKYFDQIVTGEKKAEYRLITPYWVKKLVDRKYDNIVFQVGYSKNSPRHTVPYKGYIITALKHEFFGNDEVSVFALPL